jgi:hypothetical protein
MLVIAGSIGYAAWPVHLESGSGVGDYTDIETTVDGIISEAVTVSGRVTQVENNVGIVSNNAVRLDGTIQDIDEGFVDLRTYTTNTHFLIRILTTGSEAGGLSVGSRRTAINCGSTEGIGLRVTIGGLAIGVETNNPITSVQYDLEDNVSAIPRSSAVVSYVGAAAAPQAGTNDTPTLVTPRWIGDEYVVHGATSMIYRAFGATTNDWLQVHP